MQKILPSAALAIVLASGSAIAQTPTPPASPPASTVTIDAATEAKFKAADKDNNGVLEEIGRASCRERVCYAV